MAEFKEFAEALLDQISVEINEEKEIAKLSEKINEDSEFLINSQNWNRFLRTYLQMFPRELKILQGTQ